MKKENMRKMKNEKIKKDSRNLKKFQKMIKFKKIKKFGFTRKILEVFLYLPLLLLLFSSKSLTISMILFENVSLSRRKSTTDFGVAGGFWKRMRLTRKTNSSHLRRSEDPSLLHSRRWKRLCPFWRSAWCQWEVEAFFIAFARFFSMVGAPSGCVHGPASPGLCTALSAQISG